MKNWWIRFGCFLTGYNYDILRNSSEASSKTLKKYTASLLIVCILWMFVGYSFTNRYLKTGVIGSIFGGIICTIIVIQIERQIILNINPTKKLFAFRGIIAGLMALIGSIIIDQIIFKEDIDLEKITYIQARVEKALKPKTEELRYQIASLDTAIFKKEYEREQLIQEVEKKPTSIIYSIQTNQKTFKETEIDSTGTQKTTEKSIPVNITTTSNVPNPKINLISPLEKTITELRNQKTVKEKTLLNIRPQLENEITEKVGFLDELEIMKTLISKSFVALLVWLIWFFFLFGLEMLVLIGKINDKENDYDRTIKHHMDLQMKKLEIFAKMSEEIK